VSDPRGFSLSPNLKTALIAAITLLALVIPLWPEFDTPGLAMDEGTVLLYPELILKGWVPYRDFETFYGPMNLWTLAGAYAVFGANVFVERAVGFTYHLAILLGVFFIGRRGGIAVAMGGALCAGMLLRLAHVQAFAWLGGVACLIWAVLALGEAGRWRAVGGGVLAAAALLYRPDLGPAVILATAPLLWRMKAQLRWRCAAGFAAGLVPLGALTLIAGPVNVFNNLFLYPVLYSNPGRRLPLWDAADWIQTLVFLHVGAAVFSLVAGTLVWKKQPRSTSGPLLVSASLLALGLTHQALQRVDSIHVAFAAFLSVALLPVAIGILTTRGEPCEITPVRGIACLAAALAILMTAAFPVVGSYVYAVYAGLSDAKIGSVFLTQNDRKFPFATHVQAVQTGKVLAVLEAEAEPGQRLFVGTGDLRRAYSNDTFLYHLAPSLVPATYFLEMNPLSANRPDSRLAADVATADWLVLNRFWDRWKEPNASSQHGPDAPNEVVRTQFELRRKVGDFEVYRRKRTDAVASTR
jgi:hypothetical protein